MHNALDDDRHTGNDSQIAELKDLVEELADQLEKLLNHACQTNEAFYVSGKTKDLRAAFLGQKEIIREARGVLKSVRP